MEDWFLVDTNDYDRADSIKSDWSEVSFDSVRSFEFQLTFAEIAKARPKFEETTGSGTKNIKPSRKRRRKGRREMKQEDGEDNKFKHPVNMPKRFRKHKKRSQ